MNQSKVRATGKATGTNRQKDVEWIRNNWEQYQGKWIALCGGKLIGSNDSRLALHTKVDGNNGAKPPMFFKIPKDE